MTRTIIHLRARIRCHTQIILRLAFLALAALASSAASAQSQPQPQISVKWEELTSADFVRAIQQAQGVCVLPFGIMEKHGPHLPLGTDLLNIRYVVVRAAEQEFAVVFPPYYFGQIFEARHEPGTLAYSAQLQLDLLQATTDEMARNGCKKIIIANGHGGNENLLPYFAQSQLAAPHDYVVYVFGLPELAGPDRPPLKSPNDLHAGEAETSHTMISRPDLVHLDRLPQESGADEKRLSNLPDTLYTGIWWYARFPNHYAGDASNANKALGEYDMKKWTDQLVAAIRAVKADSVSLKLQQEFFEKSAHPIDTKQ
ncbi:MAG TPA: creatininase family protein [Candidatus Acidoferrales bacterium]|nr:creatininase family protein [Candidatus Acidoferrales bacterium]